MRRPLKPGGATHWNSEAGYYAKREGQVISWWRRDPQTQKYGWHPTSFPASNLDWDFTYEDLK